MDLQITQHLENTVKDIQQSYSTGVTKNTLEELDFISTRDSIISCLMNVEENDWEQLQLALFCYLPHISIKYNDKD